MKTNSELYAFAAATIRELETESGILASSREEIFGCIFGRDSAITALKLLSAYRTKPDPYLLTLVRKIIYGLSQLQGRELTIESGEEPGKCIHEFRPEKHEHLTGHPTSPWYVYPDNIMRNYDSVDATPLFLIALFRYCQISNDDQFLEKMLPNAGHALEWILQYGDTNGDGFLDYGFRPGRTYSGLMVQNWMDSRESVFHEDGSDVHYPVAPVEVQAYAYLALRLWGDYFASSGNLWGESLLDRARALKELFNSRFVSVGAEGFFPVSGIDGNEFPILSLRSNAGHVLWAALDEEHDGKREGILDDAYIPELVRLLMSPDLFEPGAGIRTLSKRSRSYAPGSYHNGSIWPHDNSMIAEGLERFGYTDEARRVREAYLSAIRHFDTPLELFVYENGQYREYEAHGQRGCRKQAWSAASTLADTASSG